jgi:hypothetical protein
VGRYANALVRLEFPDLSEENDLIFVTIRNPKTVSADKLTPADVPNGPDGQPDQAGVVEGTYKVMADLIVDWHVYDATSNDDSDPLPLPATQAQIHTLPMEIVTRIANEFGKVITPPQ